MKYKSQEITENEKCTFSNFYFYWLMDDSVIIKIERLAKRFPVGTGEFTALHNISLTFQKGEFTGLVGPSGSGKTTLLNIIGTLDYPSEGEVEVVGRSVKGLTHKQATIYPQGRMQNIFLKGIDPNQKIIQLPTSELNNKTDEVPAIIGKRMAEEAKIKQGDRLLVRWRDKNGTFDTREVKIVSVFNCNVQSVDNNQIWIPLKTLQQITGLENEATLFIAGSAFKNQTLTPWQFKELKYLLREIDEIIQTKKVGAGVIYGLLLSIALLAIFDTQVLSVFRRQKEIGTYIALGMTRAQVVAILTIEGSAHSLLAILLGTLWGSPLLWHLQNSGIPMPKSVDSMGVSISENIFPVYSMGLILSTVLLVIISATIVSYFPTRKITKLRPTDALKGKIQ